MDRSASSGPTPLAPHAHNRAVDNSPAPRATQRSRGTGEPPDPWQESLGTGGSFTGPTAYRSIGNAFQGLAKIHGSWPTWPIDHVIQVSQHRTPATTGIRPVRSQSVRGAQPARVLAMVASSSASTV